MPLTKVEDFEFGCLFKPGIRTSFKAPSGFVYIQTDWAVQVFWDEYYNTTDHDDDTVALIVTRIPEDFAEFRARFGDYDWDNAIEAGGSGHSGFEALLQQARFSSGEWAAHVYVELIEMLIRGGEYTEARAGGDPGHSVDPTSVSHIKQLFGLKPGESR